MRWPNSRDFKLGLLVGTISALGGGVLGYNLGWFAAAFTLQLLSP